MGSSGAPINWVLGAIGIVLALSLALAPWRSHSARLGRRAPLCCRLSPRIAPGRCERLPIVSRRSVASWSGWWDRRDGDPGRESCGGRCGFRMVLKRVGEVSLQGPRMW